MASKSSKASTNLSTNSPADPEWKPMPDCVVCGYDLKTLQSTDTCPECGLLVRESLEAQLIDIADPKMVRRLHRGVQALMGTAALVVLVPVLCGLAHVLLMGLGVLFTVACFDMTAVTVANAGPYPHQRRKQVRQLVVVFDLFFVGGLASFGSLAMGGLAMQGAGMDLIMVLARVSFALCLWCLADWCVVLHKAALPELGVRLSYNSGHRLALALKAAAVASAVWALAFGLKWGFGLLNLHPGPLVDTAMQGMGTLGVLSLWGSMLWVLVTCMGLAGSVGKQVRQAAKA